MKYIKIFEEYNNAYYIEITYFQYVKYVKSKSIEMLSKNDTLEIKSFFENIPQITVPVSIIQIPQNISIRISDSLTMITIWKLEDDYFLVKKSIGYLYDDKLSNNYYKCDQLEGLVCWIKDWYPELTKYIPVPTKSNESISDNVPPGELISEVSVDHFTELISTIEEVDEINDNDIFKIKSLIESASIINDKLKYSNIDKNKYYKCRSDAITNVSKNFFNGIEFNLLGGAVVFYKYLDEWWLSEISIEKMSPETKLVKSRLLYRKNHFFIIDSFDGIKKLISDFVEIFNIR